MALYVTKHVVYVYFLYVLYQRSLWSDLVQFTADYMHRTVYVTIKR